MNTNNHNAQTACDSTITISLWLFKNHPNKQAVIDLNRYWNVEFEEWYNDVYETMQSTWRDAGLDVSTDDMYFSGFHSQGDGACFTKASIDWHLFWPQLTGNYPLLSRFKEAIPQPSLHKNCHRYCHENTVNVEVVDQYGYQESEVAYQAIASRFKKMPEFNYSTFNRHPELWEHLQTRFVDRFNQELEALSDEVSTIFRNKMIELYQALQREYDSLTSDDCLAEYFLDSELAFDQAGKLH